MQSIYTGEWKEKIYLIGWKNKSQLSDQADLTAVDCLRPYFTALLSQRTMFSTSHFTKTEYGQIGFEFDTQINKFQKNELRY